jgi:hypothetical protein
MREVRAPIAYELRMIRALDARWMSRDYYASHKITHEMVRAPQDVTFGPLCMYSEPKNGTESML